MRVPLPDDRRSCVPPAEHVSQPGTTWASGRFVALAPQAKTVPLFDHRQRRISAAAIVAFVAWGCAELPAIMAHDFGSVIATATLVVLFWMLARDILIERSV